MITFLQIRPDRTETIERSIREVVSLKKQARTIVSVALRTLCLTPVIAFMAYIAYVFLDGWRPIELFAISGIGILCLLLVFFYDVFSRLEKKRPGKLRRYLRNFLYVVIPMAWFVVTPALFFNATSPALTPTNVLIMLFISYIIGVFCFLAAFVIDRLRKRNCAAIFGYPTYSLYVIISLIWFAIFTILAIIHPFIGFH